MASFWKRVLPEFVFTLESELDHSQNITVYLYVTPTNWSLDMLCFRFFLLQGFCQPNQTPCWRCILVLQSQICFPVDKLVSDESNNEARGVRLRYLSGLSPFLNIHLNFKFHCTPNSSRHSEFLLVGDVIAWPWKRTGSGLLCPYMEVKVVEQYKVWTSW